MRDLLRELRKPTASWRIEASRALLTGVRGAFGRSACVTAARWLRRAALVPSFLGFQPAMRLVPRRAGASLFGAVGAGRTIGSCRRRCGCGMRLVL